MCRETYECKFNIFYYFVKMHEEKINDSYININHAIICGVTFCLMSTF